MSPTGSPTGSRRRTAVARALALPALALVLVGAVLVAQLTHGGGRFTPMAAADACAQRIGASPSSLATTTSAGSSTGSSTGTLDGLVGALVIEGVTDAACRLHVSRAALVLDLAGGTGAGGGTTSPTPAEFTALHDGLLEAVGDLDRAGELPPSSDLVNQAVDASSLNGFEKTAINAIPDSTIDATLSTSDVLTRTIDQIDLRTTLADLDDQHTLEDQLRPAVVTAVRQSLLQRVKDLF